MRVADAPGHDEPRLPGRGRGAAALGGTAGAVPAQFHHLLRPPALVRPRGLDALAALAIVARDRIDDILEWLGVRSFENYVEELVSYFAAMFSICMVCHGELVRLRPDPRHLTGFYLMIAAGGAWGAWP